MDDFHDLYRGVLGTLCQETGFPPHIDLFHFIASPRASFPTAFVLPPPRQWWTTMGCGCSAPPSRHSSHFHALDPSRQLGNAGWACCQWFFVHCALCTLCLSRDCVIAFTMAIYFCRAFEVKTVFIGIVVAPALSHCVQSGLRDH